MVLVGNEWSHEKRKGVASAVAYSGRHVGNLKDNSERDNLKA